MRINAEGVPGVAKLDAAEFSRLYHLPHSHLVIENAGSAVVGYLLAFPSHAPYDGEEFVAFLRTQPAPFLYIDQVAVQRDMRGMQAGSLLYEALETSARQSRMSSLCCEVNVQPPNPESMVFHLKQGFVEKGRLETTDGRTVALMSKWLA